MVYSIGRKSVFDTGPDCKVIGGDAAWANLQFLHPETVDRLALIPGRLAVGQGYPIVPDSAPKAMLWNSKRLSPPDYAFGNNEVMLVSARFRDLAEQFEPGLHQFLPVEMYDSEKAAEPFDRFYWFVCCTLIDSIDPVRTTLTWRGEYDTILEDGLRKGFWKFDHDVSPPPKPVYSLESINGRHLWRDPYYTRSYVNCSDDFGNAMIAANLAGFGLEKFEQV